MKYMNWGMAISVILLVIALVWAIWWCKHMMPELRRIKRIRWIARILGLCYDACIIGNIVNMSVALGPCPIVLSGGFATLYFFMPYLALCIASILIIMLGLAWRWPGRWPELTVGVAFIVWGLALLPASWSFITTLPYLFSAFQVLILIFLPIAIGVLFILAYKKSKYAKP